MPELSDPLTRKARAQARLLRLERTWEQIARLQSQFRLELSAWTLEDFSFGDREFAGDELALALAESPGTAGRWIETAQMYAAFPAVVERVGKPLSEGGWSVRHADAALEAIAGLGLTEQQQHEAVELVLGSGARTPHEVRKAAAAAAMALDPEAAARRYAKAKKDRDVTSGALGDGGSATLCATGPVSQVASLMASIDCLAGPKQPGDTRTLAQRRFDALMDLVCGRVAPGQWQALVVVTLSTLEKVATSATATPAAASDPADPAEVPGFGLISEQEALDVLGIAEFRRAVVDEHGHLVSVDSQVLKPDSAPELDRTPGLSLEVEPEPLDRSPEDPPTATDQQWHDQQQDQAAQDRLEQSGAVTGTRDLEETGDLEAGLAALLSQHALVGAPATSTFGPLGLVLEVDTRTHHHPGGGGSVQDRDEDPDSGGSGTDPDLPFDDELDLPPDPPSYDDQQWAETTLDRAAQDAQEPPPVYQREPDDPPDARQRPRPTPRTLSWTPAAINAAHRRLQTSPVDHRPLDSSAYALPPRLARYVKTRDLTCTFPACRRLARDCENDHLVPFPQGPSSARNISSECKHHHLAKHHYFLAVTRQPDGSLRWTTPLGRSYDRHPRPLLRGW